MPKNKSIHVSTRLHWVRSTVDPKRMVNAFNDGGEELGYLAWERVGGWMHWCWYQYSMIRMSPGCLEEVRDKQRELLKGKKDE